MIPSNVEKQWKQTKTLTEEVPRGACWDRGGNMVPRGLQQQKSGAPEAKQGQKVLNSLSKIDVFKKNNEIP